MNFNLLQHCVIPNEVSNVEKKQQLQLRKTPLHTEEKRKPINKNVKLLKNPDPIDIKAYLTTLELKKGSAKFYNLDEPINDYFYKLLKSKSSYHRKINTDLPYHDPFTYSDFKFKISKNTLLLDSNDEMALTNDLINKPCIFTLKILPYELDDICGLNIRVSKIKLYK